jgi:hypothetical protein
MADESRKKGEVVIQRVERDPAQVTRRYVVLVLSPAAEPNAAAEVVEALQRALPGVVARREGSGEGDGNGDRPPLDLRAGVALQGTDAGATSSSIPSPTVLGSTATPRPAPGAASTSWWATWRCVRRNATRATGS